MADKTENKTEQKAQKPQKTQQKPEGTSTPKKAYQMEEKSEMLVRVLGYDIPGSRNLIAGLTWIKGISWAISNAVCLQLKFSRNKKISELSKDDIKKIEDTLKNLQIPDFMKNRRFDHETGETKHVYGSDLDMIREFDIKRLKKIKSYKGVRHAYKLPVRGQRTRSHFRKNKLKAGGKVKKNEKKA